jgi:hypothetical protein
VNGPVAGQASPVPEAPDLGDLYERELPQKDQLCGAFWGALALAAAGHPADQDEVALRAGTTLAEGDPSGWLPPGASPRTDYRLGIPVAADGPSSGTSATGVARAIEELSGGGLAVVPVAGPWSAQTVVSLVEVVASSVARSPTGCTLVANLRTGRLWGSRPGPALLLDHLSGRPVQPPGADWDCGHFVGIAGSVGGAGGALVIVRDTYRQLGWDGYHLQPAGAMAAAIARGDGKEGGVLCVCGAAAAGALARGLEGAGFELRHWDNGSADPGNGG